MIRTNHLQRHTLYNWTYLNKDWVLDDMKGLIVNFLTLKNDIVVMEEKVFAWKVSQNI